MFYLKILTWLYVGWTLEEENQKNNDILLTVIKLLIIALSFCIVFIVNIA